MLWALGRSTIPSAWTQAGFLLLQLGRPKRGSMLHTHKKADLQKVQLEYFKKKEKENSARVYSYITFQPELVSNTLLLAI